MSAPILPETQVRLSRSLATRARIATGLARLLIAFPPRTIHAVLGRLTRGAERADARDVLAWRNAVNSVSRRCAGDGCLQRSVAVMFLARSFGVSPVWRTGFRPSPFVAHAWVEVDGTPVGEPEAVKDFRTVLRVDAHGDEPT
jgi:hypothetical protein